MAKALKDFDAIKQQFVTATQQIISKVGEDANKQEAPPFLYHYTSAEGLRGILRSGGAMAL